ncbi:MAG TPA: cytochrome c oxidase subunit 3 family protein [Myxococcales bacterium]|nr:cytochrome c oxidase subunit 3 family protein [Myxococcales bacterium]
MSHEAEAGLPPGILGHHFSSLARQNEAARLGMWLFLATEILLFAGLFTGYAVYRFQFPEAFAECSRHLELTLGTVNTVVLITSSLTVALAIHFARTNRPRAAAACLVITILFALAFLGIKAVEYTAHFHEKSLPGKYYAFEEVKIPGAAMFFSLYFLMTGLHALHVIAGMIVLGFNCWHTLHGRYSSRYYTGLELGGMYWHLVDMVWIFLYPLLYLI